ncbi:MAG: glycosyltransferase [bacterium]
MPRVSVVIPAYNHEKYIAGTIQSVLDQTYGDFEIVLVDDASTDGTPGIIKRFHDPRLKAFYLETNRGASAAASMCVQESAGEYVAFLNSDDQFFPDKLEKQVRFLDAHPHVGALFGYAHIVDDAGRELRDVGHPYRTIFIKENRTRFQWLAHFFHVGNCLCHSSAMIRRTCYEKVGLYDKRYFQLPDFDLWVRLCLKYEIHVVPEDLVRFRVRKDRAGVSADSPDARVRKVWEVSRILDNYLRIRDPGDFLKVFPEADKFHYEITPELTPFILALIAMDTGKASHRLFAMNTLYDLLAEEETAALIRGACGFSHKDLCRLAGECDLFNILPMERINRLLNTAPGRAARKIYRLKKRIIK